MVLSVVGCSGASAFVATGGPPDADGGAHDGSMAGDSAVDVGSIDSSVAVPDSSSGEDARDAAANGDASDASVVSDGSTDASVDEDAGQKPDAGVDVDAGGTPDAGEEVDASEPPPTCTDGDFRCNAYKTEKCVNNAWQWLAGTQDCCHDARFQVNGNNVFDSTTGRTWYKAEGRAASQAGADSLCGVLGGYRLPTTAELQAVMLGGPPIENKAVCSPALDANAFTNLYPGDSFTSDGCIDLDISSVKIACTEETVGFFCIAP